MCLCLGGPTGPWGLPLIVLTVLIHVVGLAMTRGAVPHIFSRSSQRRPTALFVIVTGTATFLATCLHAIEAMIWAIAYTVLGAIPSYRLAVLYSLNAMTIGGTRSIMLPLAMAVTVLLSSYVARIQTMWRQVPIRAAFVIATGLEYHSRKHGLIAGVGRMNEVLFGCFVGLVVAWLVSVVWPLSNPVPTEQPAPK